MSDEIGFKIDIPDKVFNDLAQVDMAIKNIAKTAEKTSAAVSREFGNMAGSAGLLAFMNQLKTANAKIGSLSGIDKGLGGIDKLGETAKDSTDDVLKLNTVVSELAGTITKLSDGGLSSPLEIVPSAEAIDDISKFKAELKALREAFKEDGDIDNYIIGLQKLQQEYPTVALQANILGTSLGKLNAISKEVKDALVLGDTPTLIQEKEVTQAISLLKTLKSTADEGSEEFNKYRDAIAKYTAQLKEMSKVPITYDSAIAASKEAKSIAQRIEAIKKLKIARDNLSTTDDKYESKLKDLNNAIKRNTELNNQATGAINNQAKSQSKLLDITGQLARQAALYFSVSQIKNYIKKLAKVRGEFELQQKSLRAIMQDKYQADKVWAQIVDLSVQSPFRLKELTSYTKQLAAYRIENEKIFDVTKMLADVSAGIGISMDRLILAYGQVKAANYLRGTELRQFSEAGINILGELSKYFTELEGRAISTADVFEMVSKRMVSFDDVNTIFERLTQSGGIFYNMQELQAETLAGKISNLGDAFDIMLNKIGKDNEGILKGSIDSIRSLLSNYEEILFMLKALVVGGGAWVVVQKLITAEMEKSSVWTMVENWGDLKAAIDLNIDSMKVNITWQKVLNALQLKGVSILKGLILTVKGLASAFKTALPFLLIAGIAELWRQMTEASRAAAKLEKALNSVIGTDITNLNKQIKGYEDLVERIKIANDGSKDRRDIVSQLNSQYGEYLDFVVKETSSVTELADAYEDVTKRIKEKMAAQTFEKGVATIEEHYSEKITEARDEFENAIRSLQTSEGAGGLSISNIIPTTKEINDIYTLTERKIESLYKKDKNLVDSTSKRQNILREIIKQYYDLENVSFPYAYGNDELNVFTLLIDRLQDVEKLSGRVKTSFGNIFDSQAAKIAFEELKSNYTLLIEELNNKKLSPLDLKKQLADAKQSFDLGTIDLKFKFGEISEVEKNKQRKNILDWASATTSDLNDKFEKAIKLEFDYENLSKEAQAKIDEIVFNMKITPQIQSEGLDAYIKGLSGSYDNFVKAQNSLIEKMNQGIVISKEEYEINEQRKRQYEAMANVVGVQLGEQNKLSSATSESVNQKMAELFTAEELNRVFANQVGLAVDLLDQEKSRADVLSENKTQYDKVKSQVDAINRSQAEGVLIDAVKLGNLEQELEMRELLNKLLGGESLVDSKRTRSTIPLIQQQFELVKELNAKYEEQRKYWNDEEAHSRTILEYRQAISQVGLGHIDLDPTQEYIDKLKDFEGFREKAYKVNGKGNWTVGYGFESYLDGTKVKEGDTISKEEADKMLNEILEKNYAEPLRNLLTSMNFTDISDKMFAPLLDLSYNGGLGLVESLLKDSAGDMAKVGSLLETYATTNKATGEKMDGLIQRAAWRSSEWTSGLAKLEELPEAERQAGFILSGILKDAKLTDQGVVDLFNTDYFATAIAKQEPKVQLAFKKLLGSFGVQIDIETKVEGLEALSNDIDSAFGDYEMTMQLQDLDFDKDMAKNLFNFDYVSLDGLRKNIDKLFGEFKNKEGVIDYSLMSDEQVKEYKSALGQISDYQVKEQEATNKQVYELLKKTYTEREQLERDYQKNLKAIRESNQLTDEQKTSASANEKTKYEGESASLDLKDIQSLELYKYAFEDLDRVGSATIDFLVKKLQELGIETVKNLPIEEQREYYNIIKKLRDENEGRNPFSSIIDGYREYATAKKDYNKALEDGDEQGVIDAQNRMATSLAKARKGLESAEEYISKYSSAVSQSVSLLTDFAEASGIAVDPETKAVLDGITKGFSLLAGVMGTVVAVEAAVTAGGEAMQVALWPLLIIGASLGAIFAIVGAHDASREKTIEAETRKVELLQKAYEKLETQFDQAYTTDELEGTTEKMLNNINAQIASLEKAREAEKDKKKSDQDAIDDYNEQIKDAEQQAIDARLELTRELGGIGSDEYKSAAQSFIEAWEDAFLETGDGLSGLEDEFEETMMRIVRAQALSRVTDTYMKNWFGDIDDLVNSYGTGDFAKNMEELRQKVANKMPELSAVLEEIYKSLGVTADGSSSELSGIQQGLSAATEDQMAAVEAYLNSLRFEVFRQGEVFNAMLLAMQAVASLNNVENSIIYQELVKQTALLRSIDNRIESVIGDGATSFIKTNL